MEKQELETSLEFTCMNCGDVSNVSKNGKESSRYFPK